MSTQIENLTNDEKELFALELKISKLLRYGVIVAGTLMLAGWLGRLNLKGNPLGGFRTYQAQPFLTMFAQAWSAHDVPIILSNVGLVALISLPFLRVMMTAYLFFKQKDYALAGIAAFVLVVLVISCTLGLDI